MGRQWRDSGEQSGSRCRCLLTWNPASFGEKFVSVRTGLKRFHSLDLLPKPSKPITVSFPPHPPSEPNGSLSQVTPPHPPFWANHGAFHRVAVLEAVFILFNLKGAFDVHCTGLHRKPAPREPHIYWLTALFCPHIGKDAKQRAVCGTQAASPPQHVSLLTEMKWVSVWTLSKSQHGQFLSGLSEADLFSVQQSSSLSANTEYKLLHFEDKKTPGHWKRKWDSSCYRRRLVLCGAELCTLGRAPTLSAC